MWCRYARKAFGLIYSHYYTYKTIWCRYAKKDSSENIQLRPTYKTIWCRYAYLVKLLGSTNIILQNHMVPICPGDDYSYDVNGNSYKTIWCRYAKKDSSENIQLRPTYKTIWCRYARGTIIAMMSTAILTKPYGADMPIIHIRCITSLLAYKTIWCRYALKIAGLGYGYYQLTKPYGADMPVTTFVSRNIVLFLQNHMVPICPGITRKS